MAHALYYVSRVIYKIHEFLVNALEVVCSDKRAREELLSQISEDVVTRYETSLQQARFLVNVERDGNPYTLNGFFRRKLAELQSRRMEKELSEKKSTQFDKSKANPAKVISTEDVQSTMRDKDDGKYIAEEVHDLIKSYYEVARDRFIDNIYLQIITHHLVSGEQSPLRLFSEAWVLGLAQERLDAIAGESSQTRSQRERLTRRIQDLSEAVAILR